MPPKTSIKIIKVPNVKPKNAAEPVGFERMPKLYLELFENKSKIRQDLINKEYKPNDEMSTSDIDDKEEKSLSKTKKKLHRRHVEEQSEEISEREEENQSEDHVSIDIKPERTERPSDRQSDRQKGNSANRPVEDISEDDYEERSKSDSKNEGKREDSGSGSGSLRGEEDVSKRLKELLEESDNEEDEEPERERVESRKETPIQPKRETYKNSAPSLAQLEATGKFAQKRTLRNTEQLDRVSQEDYDMKRELLFKIDILKKTYKNAIIPDVSIHSDYSTIKDMYDSALRSLSLDSTVKKYKNYLIGGFGVVEFILGNFLHFDMNGFTTQQIVSMDSYDQLLIELGEKTYVSSGESKWPVELRLVFLIIMNTAFFLLSKMIMKKSGNNILNMMNGMNNNSIPTSQPVKKRHMRGPSMNPDDLPDIEQGEDM